MPFCIPTALPAVPVSCLNDRKWFAAFPIFVMLLVGTVPAEELSRSREQADFFERRIRPVLIEHCYECHAGDEDAIQGGLRLDDPGAMQRGGDSGSAVTPGDPDKSLLLTAIRYDDLEMPPEGRLPDRIVRDFEKWIELGAVDPREADPALAEARDADIDWEQARSFWAFQPPQPHQAPATADSSWPATKLDRFVLARLERHGLTPSAPADRRVLIRRLYFDLVGMPPTPEEIEAYLNDRRGHATRRLVDRLLSSPAHAERWARVWLDVARYAEDQAHIVGNNDSLTYPNAYRYRDWVIEALAADLAYDQFVRLQLAADLIDADEQGNHLALGFLGLGPKYYRRNSPEVMADEWEDRIDTVSRGLLGLTVACARCHDHKYDPIPTEDYYALAGVFAGTEMFNRPLDESVEANKDGQAKKPQNAVHIVREGKPQDLQVMIRGDVSKRGPLVKRRFLTVLCRDTTRLDEGSGRRQLAEAIVDRDNPLAARVIVNRVWHQFFGQPLVGTPSNFGMLGERPSHPALLDDLAVRFMEQGWSLKWLQREIVLSATYQQSSDLKPEKLALDPGNRWLWRMTRRRMSVEGYRDALLAVSGQLDRQVGGVSHEVDEPESSRRTIYGKVSRLDLNPWLARFDFPDPNAHSAKRVETTTPLQKLFLLNSPFLVQQADRLAARLEAYGGSYRSRIEYAYRLLFGRPPTVREAELGEQFVEGGAPQLWSQYAQALLISNEMFMVD